MCHFFGPQGIGKEKIGNRERKNSEQGKEIGKEKQGTGNWEREDEIGNFEVNIGTRESKRNIGI